MSNWYVIHTNVNAEFKAAFHLKRQGFCTYLPSFKKKRKHARKVDWVQVPLFSRYLFINFDIESTSWRSIHSTIGVKSLICIDAKPAVLKHSIIEDIKRYEDDFGNVKVQKIIPFRHGMKIQFKSGPLTNQYGFFDCQTDGDRVSILFDLLGRTIKVHTFADAIDAVS
jgi:transcriptional antiterminator RfaH